MRANGRCPTSDFLNDLDHKLVKKFKGSFNALATMGAKYVNHERFKPLSDAGKPLWEFKEHGHRLYCFRKQDEGNASITVVLFNGWEKDKKGRTKEEDTRIATARALLDEFLVEFPGGKI